MKYLIILILGLMMLICTLFAVIFFIGGVTDMFEEIGQRVSLVGCSVAMLLLTLQVGTIKEDIKEEM